MITEVTLWDHGRIMEIRSDDTIRFCDVANAKLSEKLTFKELFDLVSEYASKRE